jgi:hypothetical protein
LSRVLWLALFGPAIGLCEEPLPYSAAACAFQKRSDAAKAESRAALDGTTRGKIRSEDLAQGAKDNLTLAGRVRRAAKKAHLKLQNCSDKTVRDVVDCVAMVKMLDTSGGCDLEASIPHRTMEIMNEALEQ